MVCAGCEKSNLSTSENAGRHSCPDVVQAENRSLAVQLHHANSEIEEERSMAARKHIAKPIGERLLTLREAAEVLRLNPRTVRAYVRRGEIEARIIGGRWRFRRADPSFVPFVRDIGADYRPAVSCGTIPAGICLISEDPRQRINRKGAGSSGPDSSARLA